MLKSLNRYFFSKSQSDKGIHFDLFILLDSLKFYFFITGFFPYEWMDFIEKLDWTSLPPHQTFFLESPQHKKSMPTVNGYGERTKCRPFGTSLSGITT